MGKKVLPFWEDISSGYIKVPKDLFRNEKYINISPTAKLLYGLLLDRTSLSATKGDSWKTERGEFYVIFKLEEIMDRMQCGHDKASKMLKELVDVGLISRVRKKRSQAYQIVVNPVDACANKQQVRMRDNRNTDIEETDVNNTETNNHNINKTDRNTTLMRLHMKTEIKTQIAYDVLLDRIPQNYLDCIVDVIVDSLCAPMSNIRVAGQSRSAADVRKQLMQITEMDINYVYDRLQREKHDIQYLNGYVLARLLESDSVKDVYYDHWVSCDHRWKNN